MITVYIDSIISPHDYNYAYNYDLTSDLKYLHMKKKTPNVTQNNILDIISNTSKDEHITGTESFVYKDTDGTLKQVDINGISDMIYERIKQKLISNYDKEQDKNIQTVSDNINNINNINIWSKFN